mgnify:CR=1 FL=1
MLENQFKIDPEDLSNLVEDNLEEILNVLLVEYGISVQ